MQLSNGEFMSQRASMSGFCFYKWYRKLCFFLFLYAIVLVSPILAKDESGAFNRLSSLSKTQNQEDASPWGMATGAEWLNAYPQFNPLLRAAGVKWLRAFQEWQSLEPKQGYWNWSRADHLVQSARENDLNVTWVLGYFAPWASADGSTRKFPIKNIQYWRDYVSKLVERYHQDIRYWEVWNEFNGGFADGGTPQHYAELVREASLAAKAIDPAVKIGISVANFDVHFLEAAIKAGAAGHFDYVCVHPYEKMGELENDGEVAFLAMATSLRQMLAANNQPTDLPMWITEIGEATAVRPNTLSDTRQAVALAKAYLLAIASGFQKVFWFEARGPSSGNDLDHGIIRSDFTLRPSYLALKTLSDALGPTPISKGWIELGNGGFGFLFSGSHGPLLAAWAPSTGDQKITFPVDITKLDIDGNQTIIRSGEELTLTKTPILLLNPSEQIVYLAERNKDHSYPWGGNYSKVQTVRAKLGSVNAEDGLKQIRSETTNAIELGGDQSRRLNFALSSNEGHYAYFSVNPGFARDGSAEYEIKVVAQRLEPGKLAGFSLNYESRSGYTGTSYANVPEAKGWHELAWTIKDANFAGQWGWNFRLNAISSPNEFLVKEVSVTRTPR